MLKKLFIFFFLFFVFRAECSQLELTQIGEDYCYDGDTCYAQLVNVPDELKSVRIRIRSIDTPEIKGKCAVEKELAKEAKTFINKLIKEAHIVRLSNLSWGKYGGRILADLYVDNTNYLVFLKGKAFYTLYQGGKKTKDWCE